MECVVKVRGYVRTVRSELSFHTWRLPFPRLNGVGLIAPRFVYCWVRSSSRCLSSYQQLAPDSPPPSSVYHATTCHVRSCLVGWSFITFRGRIYRPNEPKKTRTFRFGVSNCGRISFERLACTRRRRRRLSSPQFHGRSAPTTVTKREEKRVNGGKWIA